MHSLPPSPTIRHRDPLWVDLFRAQRLTVNCSTLLTDLPIAARAEAVRAAGFGAMEMWWPFPGPNPSDAEVDGFVRAVRDAGVRLSALNFTGGAFEAGERGLVSLPGRESEFRDSVDVAVAIGSALGSAGFNALYGCRDDAHRPSRQDEVARENLHYAARAAASIGATVYVEPLSGVPAYPVRRIDHARAVVDAVTGVPPGSIGVLADLYHLAVNDDPALADPTGWAGAIAHVQIADVPGRGAPGSGRLDLHTPLRTLHTQGYRGYVGLEYFDTTDDPFGWLREEVNS
ncbi:TIM barrel protein [Rhodococcus indonesiensis]|uniref:TIM barrel protein n=1 Tax=Rhodococcus indonesiensis TaxID=3055869 RepID=UPI0039F6EE35